MQKQSERQAQSRRMDEARKAFIADQGGEYCEVDLVGVWEPMVYSSMVQAEVVLSNSSSVSVNFKDLATHVENHASEASQAKNQTRVNGTARHTKDGFYSKEGISTGATAGFSYAGFGASVNVTSSSEEGRSHETNQTLKTEESFGLSQSLKTSLSSSVSKAFETGQDQAKTETETVKMSIPAHAQQEIVIYRACYKGEGVSLTTNVLSDRNDKILPSIKINMLILPLYVKSFLESRDGYAYLRRKANPGPFTLDITPLVGDLEKYKKVGNAVWSPEWAPDRDNMLRVTSDSDHSHLCLTENVDEPFEVSFKCCVNHSSSGKAGECGFVLLFPDIEVIMPHIIGNFLFTLRPGVPDAVLFEHIEAGAFVSSKGTHAPVFGKDQHVVVSVNSSEVKVTLNGVVIGPVQRANKKPMLPARFALRTLAPGTAVTATFQDVKLTYQKT